LITHGRRGKVLVHLVTVFSVEDDDNILFPLLFFLPNHGCTTCTNAGTCNLHFQCHCEYRNIRTVSKNLASLSDVAVPIPIDAEHPSNTVKGGLCTKKVLTMTLLRGQALQKKLNIQMEKFAKLQGMSVDELKLKMRKQMKESTSQSVSPPSPYLMKAFNYYLYLRDLTKNTWAWVYNSVYQPLLGGPLFPYETSEPPMNGTTLTYTIWRAHAHQLFTDGFLNGDPHPGNIMILDDGRVGLIDFGQMQKVSVESRILIAKLILAIKANNSEKIVSLWARMGFKTKNMDPYVLEKHARVAFDSLGPGEHFLLFRSIAVTLSALSTPYVLLNLFMHAYFDHSSFFATQLSICRRH
jgi:hypothetical protein